MHFELSEKDLNKINTWLGEHECSARTSNYGIENERYAGAIGGSTTYCFTPTGLGTMVSAKCVCNKVFDITDWEVW